MSASQNFPGPYCKAAYIAYANLRDRCFPQNVTVSNGLVLELNCYATKENLSAAAFVKILENLSDDFSSVRHSQAVVDRIKRVIEQKKKLCHRKKVKCVKRVKELLDQILTAPVSNVISTSHSAEITLSQSFSEKPEHVETTIYAETLYKSHNENTNNVERITESTQTENTDTDESAMKEFNLVKYKHNVLVQQNNILTRKLNAKRTLLKKVDDSLGHYSVCNVNKRDEKARKNSHLLRESQRTYIKL